MSGMRVQNNISVNQKKIARDLGIAQITVSRALNEDARVRPELRKKIADYAVRSGYIKNRLACSFQRGRTHLIGVLIPRINCSFFPDLANHLEMLANKSGYHLILAYTNEQYDKTLNEIRLLLELRVDGLMIVPPLHTTRADIYVQLRNMGKPFVMIDRYLRNVACHAVTTDNMVGGWMATRHLISLGYRRIGHIRGPHRTTSSDELFAGYKKAMKEARAPIDAGWISGEGFEEQDGYEAMRRLMDYHARPRSVFAVNDVVAVGAIRYCRERALRIPEDVALVGYSDISYMAFLNPPLTTVRENTGAMAKAAFDILCAAIHNRHQPVKRIRIMPELIVRASCGAGSLRE